MIANFCTESLDLEEVLEIVMPLVSEWDTLAILLGLKSVTIDDIKADRKNKTPLLCLTAAISEWLDDDKYDATKKKLEEAMYNLEQPELVSYL